MIGVPLGLFYANAVEWVVHRYLLHVLGKKKNSIWAFHWREHHRNCRRFGMMDPDFQKPLTDWNARGKEAAGVALLCAAHLPLAGVAPFFTAAVCFSGFNYLRKHRKAHRHPEWAMKHMKWHVDHHLGKNQDANWCVSQPWFDYILGTRIDYPTEALRVAGTEVDRVLASELRERLAAAHVANDVSDVSDERTSVPPDVAA